MSIIYEAGGPLLHGHPRGPAAISSSNTSYYIHSSNNGYSINSSNNRPCCAPTPRSWASGSRSSGAKKVTNILLCFTILYRLYR